LALFTSSHFVSNYALANGYITQDLYDRARAATKAANEWKLKYAPLTTSGESKERVDFLLLSNGSELTAPESAWRCVGSYGEEIGFGFYDNGSGMMYIENISATPEENTTIFFWKEKVVNDRMVLAVEFSNNQPLILSGLIYFQEARQLELSMTDTDGYPSYLSCDHMNID